MEPTVSPTEVQTIPGRVLVRVQEGTPVEQVQEIAQAVGAEVDRVLAPWGLYLFRFHESVPVQEVVEQLQSYAAVRYAEPDVRYLASGHWETNATARALEGTGGPVVVAVLDTGMDLRHEAFAGRLTVNAGEIAGDGIDNDHNGYVDDVNGYDFYDRDGNPTGSADTGAHGTGVAGRVLEGASGGSVSILSLRVGPGPFLDLSAIIEAIGYAVNQGARIINMSFGSWFPSQALADAVRYAADRGVLLVAAAGNGGTSLPDYPAAFSNVISVAASDATGRKTWWSNYGSTVDFTAPGDQVTTTTFGGGTAVVSGTSFSAPFVAGVAARIWAALPQLTPDQVVQKMREFAKDVDALNTFLYRGLLGSGLIDGEVASRVADALPLPTSGQEPSPPPDRAQLETELAAARLQVKGLEAELVAADQILQAAQQKAAQVNQEVNAAQQGMLNGWRELSEVWRAWYKSGFRGPTDPVQRQILQQKMRQAFEKLFKAYDVLREARARLQVATAEEAKARSARADIAARLRSARGSVDELNRRLAAIPPVQSQSQTHALVHQLHAVLDRLGASPLPPGLSARSSSDLIFTELSESNRRD